MPSIIHLNELNLREKESPVFEFCWKTSEDLSAAAGQKDFCSNIRVLEKGKYSYPYHYHHNSDEIFVILSGKGDLRTPDGIKCVGTGDVLLFERGAEAAHQIYNGNDEPLVYLDLRSLNKLDVCEYPDTGKVNILPRRDIFHKGGSADYFDGEENVREVWKKMKSGS